MTKADAKIIAISISNQELFDMLNQARQNVPDWNVRSLVNRGMSKGTAWNVLGKIFDVNEHYHPIAKFNMVREFGDYLPDNLKIKKVKKQPLDEFFHNEPDFTNWGEDKKA